MMLASSSETCDSALFNGRRTGKWRDTRTDGPIPRCRYNAWLACCSHEGNIVLGNEMSVAAPSSLAGLE